MSQSPPSAEPPSAKADNHPPQPRTDDAVLGGAAPLPVSSVVLGGLDGIKRRLASASALERIAALKAALNYGEAGLELVMLGLEDESRQVQYMAFSLLTAQDLPSVKQRLKNYLPWFEFEVVTVDGKGRETQRYRSQAQYFSQDLGNGICLDMVYIPGGTFLMGSPNTEEGHSERESPQHQVTVPSFFIGKYPVTQAQWQAVATLPQVNRELEPYPSWFKGTDRPVERVCWYDAVEFCTRLSKHTEHSYRLPSEAEWEYAARAGTTTPFHFGETITTELANYDSKITYGYGVKGTYGYGVKGEYRGEATPVGSFGVANNFGLYDMHGNVWEWCADSWHGNYEGAPSDGSAWQNDYNYRLLRGGSWCGRPELCRSAYRYLNLPNGMRNSNVGFRVVCAAEWTQ